MSTLLDLDQKRGQNFLTGRALEALVAMLNILVICIVTLTPHILKGALAAFVLLTAVASAISPVRARGLPAARSGAARPCCSGSSFAFALTLCLLVCGITLAAGHGGGLFWLPAAFVIAIVVASVNSWVLLIEVLC